jgi:GNAT superfamily N-acetyltransferase
VLIRPPLTSEAEEVATLMREGMTANVRRITILGSAGLHRWVEAQLAEPGGDDFLVAVCDGRIVGMVSSRLVGATRVLNHLYTHTDFRRRGIARALLAGAVRDAAETVAVDVFAESRVARAWYAALGFTAEYRRLWVETPLSAAATVDPQRCAQGLAEADAAQARMGFSHFRLTTERGAYAIARLAEAVFRCAGFGILADPTAMAALAAIDARRTLLCFGAPEDVPAEALCDGRVVEESERLSTPRAALAARLASPGSAA